MIKMDRVNEALIHLKNSEQAGKETCLVKPSSKMIGNILKILQKKGYIGDYEHIENGRGGAYEIHLKGKINNCKAVKPRYSIKKDEYQKWEKRYLPAKGFGEVIVTTSKGVMTSQEAREIGVGGRIVAFIY